MLGKLWKHEMKATSKLFLPMMAGFILITVLCKFSFESVYSLSINNRFLGSVTVIFFTLYFIYIIALFVMTSVFIVMRFYKTMVGEQGYLTNTLPVKASAAINSKLLAAVLWEVIAGVLLVLSFIVFAAGHVDFRDFGVLWNEIMEMFTYISDYINLPLLLFEIFVCAIVGLFSGPLMLYAAIAHGHLFKKHRIMYAIISYFGIYIAMQIITSIVTSIFGLYMPNDFQTNWHAQTALGEGYMLFVTAFSVACTAGFYAITNYVFSKKLNLD